jgi:hypothetical protein
VSGWYSENEFFQALDDYKQTYQAVKAIFKQIGSPRSSERTEGRSVYVAFASAALSDSLPGEVSFANGAMIEVTLPIQTPSRLQLNRA